MAAIDVIEDATSASLARFDALIDVRSPGEFTDDHIPGAINLPVLTDNERAEVGTIYKQQTTFGARRIGAGYVSQNIARHLEHFFADKPPSSQFLIYCWRGGMRSRSMATVLAEVGWRVAVLQGGYKTWRREVVGALRSGAEFENIVLLDGQTGAGKTEILQRCAELGLQCLDLEKFAAHRGSVFGAEDNDQPSQKLFESRLWRSLREFDPSQAILVEAESNRIGRCEIPKRLWRSMQNAPCITVEADRQQRGAMIAKTYANFAACNDNLHDALNRLSRYHSKEQISEWRSMADARQLQALAISLIEAHYDPRYERARKRRRAKPLACLSLADIKQPSLHSAAREICSVLEAQAPDRLHSGSRRDS
ncbi:MAG: tRNA 2-selenouridine(34) synthase MnmH [Hyphococcus sp.]